MGKVCPSERETISVVLADADPLTSALLAALLNGHRDFEVLAAVGDRNSLLKRVHEGGADVAPVGLDLADGPLSGLTALQTARELDPQLRLTLLLNLSDRHLVLKAVRSGARGIFSRSNFDPARLIQCIQRVREGQIWLNTLELECVLAARNQTPDLHVLDAQAFAVELETQRTG